ncbi:MAG: hypothetical protein ACRC20_05510 [Segniliparus sp.]|uniref:hypothetical protein n=1 Tax=Segniliparus sp. TaxID=2804064 RepID=UPI003F3AA9B0
MTAIPERLRTLPAALPAALLLMTQLPAPPAAWAAGTPTVTISSALPGAIGDPTNPSVLAEVHDSNTPEGSLVLRATSSSNPAVAPVSSVSFSGSGSKRYVSVNPVGVGYADITIEVSDPSGDKSTDTLHYAASAASNTPATTRYYTGSSDASGVVDAGGGYVLVADDENNVVRLYQDSTSGPPAAEFNFSSQLGTSSEIDFETMTRVGDRLYLTGSMGNSSSGTVKPEHSRLVALQVSGSGASTVVSWVGRYDNLRADLVNWDHTGAHGLGADHFGLQASSAGGTIPKEEAGFNVEGMEIATDGQTAYVAFRAPLQLPNARSQALVAPVTNATALAAGTASAAAFGPPLLWNLGGNGVRDIRRNAAGQYLIIAGPAPATPAFSLYTWSGNPADQPVKNIDLPGNAGAWEAIVAVPSPLGPGASVRLVADDGAFVFYGDSTAAKDLPRGGWKKSRTDIFTLN